MKKIYTFVFLSAVTLGAVAQSKAPARKATTPAAKAAIVEPASTPVVTGEKEVKVKPNIPIAPMAKQMSLWEQVIGYSVYDLQTNNSVQDRIIVDANDTVHATWTMSFETTGFSERGTGYNSGKNFNWGAEPVDRIENIRTGWPGLFKTGDGGEGIVNHDGTGAPNFLYRPTIGSGSWSIEELPTALGRNVLWPRTATDGNTIHVIGLSEPPASTNSATPLNGLNGNLVYWRSNDNGVTWDIQDHIFAEIDSNVVRRVDSDSYAIHARDGHVSIGVFSTFADAFMLHSMDAGDNWSVQTMSTFEIPGYVVDSLSDADGDLLADTIFAADGTGDVWIDGAGVTHALFGTTFILDDTPGDGFYSFFTTFDLVYWNSTWPADSLVIAAEAQESEFDTDEDFVINNIDEVASYGSSLASMPSMGEASNGDIYFVYSAADEDYLDAQFYRHLFASKIIDNGASFLTPVEFAADEDFDGFEYVFPSMTIGADDRLHIVAMRDEEPGMLVAGDLDPAETNDIIYFAITSDLNIDINVAEESKATFSMYPNPSTGIVNFSGENLAKQSLRVYDAQGKLMLNTMLNGASSMDFSFLPNGMYTVVLGSGETKSSQELIIRK